MPVDSITGLFFCAIYFKSGKLTLSVDAILYAGIFIFSNKSTLSKS